MSTTISIRLLWGRFHANPWNRSNNEGATEWPPSPWRLLRALYSSWKVSHPDLPAESVMAVLGALSEPPLFVLPPYRESHLRHYMPGSRHLEGVSSETAKTLDSFVVTARNAVLWSEWECDLTPSERDVLQLLCEGVRYLGRAESLVECRLADGAGEGIRCAPAAEEASGAVRVLVPTGVVSENNLTQTSGGLRKARRLQPEGTRYQAYARPSPRLPVVAVRQRHDRGLPTALRLAFGGAVLPSRFQAVSVGHQLHRAAVAKHAAHSATLSGRDGDRNPLTGAHQHAHYFAVPELGDLSGRRIASAVVWAPEGFTDAELSALESITRLSGLPHGGLSAQRCAVLSVGDVTAVAPELAGKSRVWISVTPYSPAHHHRGSLIDQLRKDVARELSHRELPTVESVQLLDGSWLRYRRYRPDQERIRQQRRAYGLRLEFEEPVDGPIALGQLSHFGLGLFRPEQL